jgi:CcmD family protein
VLACVVALVLAAGSLAAQTAQDQFKPLSEMVPAETLPAAPLVFVAYAFVWVALIVYVFGLWRKLARVEQELASVSSRLNAPRR